jgi:hypothetical protein
MVPSLMVGVVLKTKKIINASPIQMTSTACLILVNSMDVFSEITIQRPSSGKTNRLIDIMPPILAEIISCPIE